MDDQLSPKESKKVQSHLYVCSACRRELEELRAVSKLVAGLPEKPLPAGFLARLERKRRVIRDSKPKSFWILPYPVRVAAFAMSSVIVFLVVQDTFTKKDPAIIEQMIQEEMIRQSSAQLNKAPSALSSLPAFGGRGVTKIRVSRTKEDGSSGSEIARLNRSIAREKSIRAAKKRISSPKTAPPPKPVVALGPAASGPADAYESPGEFAARRLEEQKKALGIEEIIPPPAVEGESDEIFLDRRATTPHRRMADIFGQRSGRALGFAPTKVGYERDAPPAARLPGNTPALLNIMKAARGAGAGGFGAKEKREAARPGALIRSGEQRASVWLAHGISSPEPQVDFAKEMLVVVYEAADGRDAVIVSVKEEKGRLVVRYRYQPAVEKTPGDGTSYYRLIPLSDRPVIFEQDP